MPRGVRKKTEEADGNEKTTNQVEKKTKKDLKEKSVKEKSVKEKVVKEKVVKSIKKTPAIKISTVRESQARAVDTRKISLRTIANENSISVIKKRATGDSLPIRHSSCIVCLKINKTLFHQIFNESGKEKKTDTMGNVVRDPYNNVDGSSISDTMNYELTQDKTINIPELYPVTVLDIQPDKVVFKHFNEIDCDGLNQKINDHHLSDKKIHVILANFKNKNWPSSSPYACWNCTEHFNHPPVGIPTIAMSDTYEDTYYMEGNFCSFPCAARHLFDTRSQADAQLFTIFEIMNFIYNEVNDSEDYEKIKVAPERICLKKFGGHLTLEEYRKNHLTNISYEVFKTPLIPALYHIQENMDINKLIRNARKNRGGTN
jgi:hypothetical protein